MLLKMHLEIRRHGQLQPPAINISRVISFLVILMIPTVQMHRHSAL